MTSRLRTRVGGAGFPMCAPVWVTRESPCDKEEDVVDPQHRTTLWRQGRDSCKGRTRRSPHMGQEVGKGIWPYSIQLLEEEEQGGEEYRTGGAEVGTEGCGGEGTESGGR